VLSFSAYGKWSGHGDDAGSRQLNGEGQIHYYYNREIP